MNRSSLIALSIALSPVLLHGCRSSHTLQRIRIDEVCRSEIDAGHLPGVVVLVGRSDKVLYWKAFGHAIITPTEEAMQKNTVFDLASLAKPIATATSIAVLADRARLDVNDYVSEHVPEFGCGGKEKVRLRHLLTHTSGLPAYTSAGELEAAYGNPCPNRVIERICRLEALNAPEEEFRYSCLGYIILARVVEIVSGRNVDEFSRKNVFEPLGMDRTRFNPPASWQSRIAATELLDGEPLRGVVHDPLARLMGGIGGNAGLFANAADLSRYCRMLLNDGTWKGRRILSERAVRMLTTVQDHGRAYGFDVSSGYSWVKGAHASKRAFCHSGYTGTSLVCDPAGKLYVIILTNRAHPHDGGTCKELRRQVADIVFSPNGNEARL